MNRYTLLGLHIISLALLASGLVLNMLKITISTNFFIDIELFNEKRSILGTLQTLWQSSNYLPFLLISLFGIMVPIAKSAIIFLLLSTKNRSGKLLNIIVTINKWAMADVFAISIFIAFLGAKAMRNTTAFLEPGFYCFTAYVLLSGFITAVLGKVLAKADNI